MSNDKLATMAFRLTRERRREILEMAAQSQRPPSQVVRMMIEYALAHGFYEAIQPSPVVTMGGQE